MKVKLFSHMDKTKIKSILKESGVKVVERDEDIIIAYGGDGTFLDAMRSGKPVLPIRSGRSVGYLSDIDLPMLKKVLKNINKIKIISLPVLVVSGSNENKYAINDVILSGRGRSIRFNILVNNDPIAKRVIGDGVIISTPLGSTAYNLSANGPVLLSKSISLTLNNPHSHRKISYVLGYSDTIQLEVKSDAEIICDGRVDEALVLNKGSSVRISLSKKKAKWIRIPNFEESIRKKLKRIMKN